MSAAVVEPETIPDIELFDATWFDAAVACEVIEGCDTEAVWRGRQTCCNLSCNLCDEHRQGFLRFIAGAAARRGYYCRHCGVVGYEVIWTKL